jgi:hypothetical protein
MGKRSYRDIICQDGIRKIKKISDTSTDLGHDYMSIAIQN